MAGGGWCGYHDCMYDTTLSAGQARMNRTCRDFPLFTISIVAVVMICMAYSGSFSATSIVYRTESTQWRLQIPDTVATGRIHESVAERMRTTGRQSPQKRLSRILDSLGFFLPTYDSSSLDTVTVNAGPRASVCSLECKAPSFLPWDSLVQFFPTPVWYDAGRIELFVRRITTWFSYHGYPFAQVGVSIDTIGCTDSRYGSDARQISLHVEPGDPSLFGTPLFVDSFITRKAVVAHDIHISPDSLFDLRQVENTRAYLGSRDYIGSVSIGRFRVKRKKRDKGNSVVRGRPPDTLIVQVPIRINDVQGVGIQGALGLERSSSGQASLSGRLSCDLHNVWRAGEAAAVQFQAMDSLIEVDGSLSYPWILGSSLTGSAAAGLEIEEQNYARTHVRVRLLRELRIRLSSGAGFRIESLHYNATDSTTVSRRFIGSEILFFRRTRRVARGVRTAGTGLEIGAGVTRSRGDTLAARMAWKAETRMHAAVNIPFGRGFALAPRVGLHTLVTQRDSLLPPELIKAGGIGSVRGYTTDSRLFKSILRAQTDFCYYFSPHGCIYLLFDAATGSRTSYIPSEQRSLLVGYGIGVRMPSPAGTVAVEWAGNIDRPSDWGRIHITFRNNFTLTGVRDDIQTE